MEQLATDLCALNMSHETLLIEVNIFECTVL